jgi:hypothetical protein
VSGARFVQDLRTVMRRPAERGGYIGFLERRGDEVDICATKGPSPMLVSLRNPCVKVYLTECQELHLLCIGGRCKLSPFDRFQSTENAHDQPNPSDSALRARDSDGYRHGRFGTRFSVVAEHAMPVLSSSQALTIIYSASMPHPSYHSGSPWRALSRRLCASARSRMSISGSLIRL